MQEALPFRYPSNFLVAQSFHFLRSLMATLTLQLRCVALVRWEPGALLLKGIFRDQQAGSGQSACDGDRRRALRRREQG